MQRKVLGSLMLFALSGVGGPNWVNAQEQVSAVRYLSRGSVLPQLRPALDALGDRLEKPGKERVILTGTISWDTSTKQTVTAVSEYPGKLRIDQGSGDQATTVTFDGKQLTRSPQIDDTKARTLLETLLLDTQEHLLESRALGHALICLGTTFMRTLAVKEGESAARYHVYHLWDKVAFRGVTEPKFYHLDSATFLLDSVHYRETQGKQLVDVEVRLGNWFEADGQRVPGRIERLENQQTTILIVFDSVQIEPGKTDGIFQP